MTYTSEARLSALLTAAVDAIVVINASGFIEEFNPAAEKIFGYHRNEVLGESVSLLMPIEYGREHNSYVKSYIDGGKPKIIGIGREVSGKRKNGSVFPVYLSVGAINNVGPPCFVGIMRDITDKVEAEQEASEHREALAHVARIAEMGEMTAGIAHEINQPLSAIANYSQACRRLIEKNQITPKDTLEILEKISTQAQRAGDIIRRLRGFVNKRQSLQEELSPNELVKDVAKFAEIDSRTHDIKIKLNLAPTLPKIQVDPIQIQQVLLNLIRNAMEATPKPVSKNASVAVKTQLKEIENECFVEFSVTDQGTGLSPEAFEQIFHPFFTTKSSGMGLGLSISRNIIAAHGGELNGMNNNTEKNASVSARKNDTKGSTFYFTIPIAIEEHT